MEKNKFHGQLTLIIWHLTFFSQIQLLITEVCSRINEEHSNKQSAYRKSTCLKKLEREREPKLVFVRYDVLLSFYLLYLCLFLALCIFMR